MKTSSQYDTKNVTAKITVGKIYTKVLGVSVLGLPEHFSASSWNPKIDIKTGPRYIPLEANRFEVILAVQLNAQQNNNPVFESHIEQAGIFIVEMWLRIKRKCFIRQLFKLFVSLYQRQFKFSFIAIRFTSSLFGAIEFYKFI